MKPSKFNVGDTVELVNPKKHGLAGYEDWLYIVVSVHYVAGTYMYRLNESAIPETLRSGYYAESDLRAYVPRR